MRSVFVRRRAETKATPAWMGGLNYEDHGIPKLPWNIEKRALSSDFASALQTRVHTGVSSFELEEGAITHQTALPIRSRPHRLQSARPRSPDTQPFSARSRRPQTAGATQSSFRTGSKSMPETQQLDARLRASSSQATQTRPATGAVLLAARNAKRGLCSLISSEKEMQQQTHRFYSLQVNILGVSGSAHGTQDDVDAESSVYNACVSLAVDGTSDGAGQTFVSKVFKCSRIAFAPVPENWVEFALTGNINRMLMAVKMLRKTSDSSKAGESGLPLGSCLLDIGAVLKAGGSKMEVCKLTHDKMGKNSLEVHLDLRVQQRKSDFDYEWENGSPVFKKAGYVITNHGIQAPESVKAGGTNFVHIFVARKEHQRKVRRQPNLTFEDLKIMEKVKIDQPVQVSKACRIDEDGNPIKSENYTLKRFRVMEADPRRQLIAELDGLLEMPVHLAVHPVDAFMDKLEVVLVLDNEDGRYLSEAVAKKGEMPERLVSIVVRQVLTALVYMHNEKMRVHNDITPANLLVLRSGEVKISGFSFSSKAFMGRTTCRFAGNYAHMAPERLLGLECGFKADVWSVGILTLELIIGTCPHDMKRFTGPTAIYDFKKTVVEEPSPSLRKGGKHSDDVRLFVDSCLNKNLKLRAECKALTVQPFIAKWEVLGPKYLIKWLNKSDKKKKNDLITSLDEDAQVGGESPMTSPGR